MAVTITSRPATWSAAKNPVVYKFETTGGPFTNYRIEVEVFNAADNASLTNGVKFAYSPGPDGITVVDISAILKAHLRADWAVIPSGQWMQVEQFTSVGYYIKYQEVYEGAPTLVQDDVANPRYAVNGALQIPNANDMVGYVPANSSKKFLTLLSRAWRGYPTTLSLICPETLTTALVFQSQFTEDGRMLRIDVNSINANQENKVIRIRPVNISTSAKIVEVKVGHPPAQPSGYTEAITVPDSNFTIGIGGVWSNIDGSGTTPWANGSGYVSVIANFRSAVIQQTLEQNLTNKYLKVDITAKWAAASGYLFRVFLEGSLIALSPPSEGTGAPKTTTLYIDTMGLPDKFDFGVQVERVFGDAVEVQLSKVAITEGVFVSWLAPKKLEIHDPCQNPVLLFWKNSLGGDSWWMFEHDQEVSYEISDRKAKRMLLRAHNLTTDQWEALNELNHIGEVYKENIIEMSPSVNKSHVREGTQVYMVDKDGNKTGVIVIPTRNVMFTKARRHQFEIEIELPERYE